MKKLYIDNCGNLSYSRNFEEEEMKGIAESEDAIVQSVINDNYTNLLIKFIESFEGI